ncbi:MAG: acyltransferase family protein [Methylophilus sp.]
MTASFLAVKNIPQNKPSRLLFLDGLRGIAILLVVFYHAYSNNWIDFLPYRDQYNDISILRFGSYGVQLFFMISGFVIAMTLEKCNSLGDFMFRRWLRLFPAMLVGSIIILISAPLFTARPYGTPHLNDLIPGLTFIEPEFFRVIFNNHQKVLEGCFWTLFVEMKFYLLAGLMYFTIGPKKMIAVLIAMFLTYVTFDLVKSHLPSQLAEQLRVILHYLNYEHYGWFAAGALFYQYSISKKWTYWIMGLLVALLAARGLGGLISISMIYASAIVLIFALSMFNSTVQKLLSTKLLVFVGFISYPFYLIHENAMISMIIQLHQQYSWIPGYLLPIAPILGIIFVSWLIARHLEPNARTIIRNILSIKFSELRQKFS